MRPVFRRHFEVTPQICIDWNISGNETVSQLRSDTVDTRLEVTKDVAGALVCGDLAIGIANNTCKELFAQEFRGAQIQMKIRSTDVVRVLILGIKGYPGCCRHLPTSLRIEIGIGTPHINRGMTSPDIGKAIRLVRADR